MYIKLVVRCNKSFIGVFELVGALAEMEVTNAERNCKVAGILEDQEASWNSPLRLREAALGGTEVGGMDF